MKDKTTFWYDLIDQLIGREGFSRPQVAHRSGVNTKTITSWLRGDVQSPRNWQPLAKVLLALDATTAEANQVLQGAGHPSVHRLASRAAEADRALLTAWLQPNVPFMPPDRVITSLIGRQAELVQATETLKRHRRCILLGMAGIGKTTLAVELAHRLRHDYPDGVFWGELRTGMADTMLESWGQACGVPMERLTDFSSRAAAMRSVFARKQALIVLDDVLDSRQALQLLPAQNTNCAVLVTTRSEDVAQALSRMQTGLRIRLEPMNRQHSLALLRSILGNEIPTTAADQVAGLLGHMPLALHICAALCADTGLPLNRMVILLRELRTRLEHLRLEEKPLVRLAFEQCWDLLDEVARRGLATLAVFGGRPFRTPAFAASLDISEAEAALLLTRLCRRSLLTATRTGNEGGREFQQHMLLAAFAAERLDESDPAWFRFSSYFGRLVSTSSWWQDVSQDTWGNVMGGMAAAHQLQQWPLLLTYSDHLTEVWKRQGLYSLARQGYRWALDAAREASNVELEAEIRLAWGRANLEQSDYQPAREQLSGALNLFTLQELNAGIAEAQYHLSRVEVEQSRHEEAEAAIQQAYRAYQEEEDVRGMGRALFRLGHIVYQRGDYERALSLTLDAVNSQRHTEDMLGLLRSHMLASHILVQLRQIEEAARHCQVAAELLEQVTDRATESEFYYTYAEVLRKQNKFVEAQATAHKALAIFREMADSSSEANALLLLAGNEVNWNDTDPERRQFDAGLAFCRDGFAACEAVDYQIGRGFLFLMKGRLLHQRGDTPGACDAWHQGLEIAGALQHTWLLQRLETLRSEAGCRSR